MYRQGDVLITPVDEIPSEAGPTERDDQGRFVLAWGEATGHAHAIHDPGVTAYTAPAEPDAVDHVDGNVIYLRVDRTVALRHEEHAPVEIPPGTYRVGGQREYHPDELRRVLD